MANPITPTIEETLLLTDTSATALVVGGAIGATTGTGGIKAGPIVSSSSVTDSVGTMATIRAGGIGIASQAALDFVHASSATQLARVAKGTGLQVVRMNSGATGYEFATLSVSSCILLHAASGTGSVTSDAVLSSYAFASGLTALDRVFVTATYSSPAGNWGAPTLYNSTDSVAITTLQATNAVYASWAFRYLSVDGTNLTQVNVAGQNDTVDNKAVVVFTTNFTGAWTMQFRAGTIVAGGDGSWSLSIYKIAGQA